MPIDEHGNLLLFKKRKPKRKTKVARFSWPQKMALLDCYDKLIERGNDALYVCTILRVTPMVISEWKTARILVAKQQAIRERIRAVRA